MNKYKMIQGTISRGPLPGRPGAALGGAALGGALLQGHREAEAVLPPALPWAASGPREVPESSHPRCPAAGPSWLAVAGFALLCGGASARPTAALREGQARQTALPAALFSGQEGPGAGEQLAAPVRVCVDVGSGGRAA